MTKQEIQQMERFEKTYWWHIGKKHLTINLLTKYLNRKSNKLTKILEIGSGAGEIISAAKKFGTVYANDISEDAIKFCSEKGISNTILGDINSLNLEKHHNTFDAVLALDVLEHIQEDVKTIEKINKLLKKRGLFIVNVPAYKFLWSAHDEALQHKRRYTSYEIYKKLHDQNFKILKLSNYVFFAFPIVATFKFISNFIGKEAYPKTSYIQLPKRLNSFMTEVLKLETKLMEHVNLPFGTTITVVAEKV